MDRPNTNFQSIPKKQIGQIEIRKIKLGKCDSSYDSVIDKRSILNKKSIWNGDC
jgi:hypothetical protein